MKIYIFKLGNESIYEFLKEFDNEKKFLEWYKKIDKDKRNNISLIIKGKEMKIKSERIEIIKSWKLEEI